MVAKRSTPAHTHGPRPSGSEGSVDVRVGRVNSGRDAME